MNRTRSDSLAPVRLLLLSLGLAAVWIVISFFVGTDSAHADEADSRSLLGSTFSDVLSAAGTATPVTASPAVAVVVVPAVRSVVVEAASATPVVAVITPVLAPVVAVDTPVHTPVVAVVTPVVAPVAAVVTPVTGSVGPVADSPTLDGESTPGVSADLAGIAEGDGMIPLLPVAERVSASPSTSISAWVADLHSGLGVNPAAQARTYPDPVPRGPAKNGTAALPSVLAATGGTSGGPTGPSAAAELSSLVSLALVSGALLSRAENDTLPAPLPLELSTTPD
ncbi:hypothetical protein [Mycetocola sp.]|uniref:hypothetical protein n=1 Tax=Mycetocola sp. TaxID=1871042 RepID=UPI0039890E0C